jgi:outer membrane lipoprotein
MRRIGEFDYRLPVVEASTLYLWPERVPVVRYDPFWGPSWGPRWGPQWRGGWHGPW